MEVRGRALSCVMDEPEVRSCSFRYLPSLHRAPSVLTSHPFTQYFPQDIDRYAVARQWRKARPR